MSVVLQRFQTSQTGGQWYSDTSPLVFPGATLTEYATVSITTVKKFYDTGPRVAIHQNYERSAFMQKGYYFKKFVSIFVPFVPKTRFYLNYIFEKNIYSTS